jgi:hypothetical protein
MTRSSCQSLMANPSGQMVDTVSVPRAAGPRSEPLPVSGLASISVRCQIALDVGGPLCYDALSELGEQQTVVAHLHSSSVSVRRGKGDVA